MSQVDAVMILKPKRDRSIRLGHPWIFSGAIDRIIGDPTSGSIVRILSSKEEPLGVGAYSPHSQIRVRVLSAKNTPIDASWISSMISQALSIRRQRVFTSLTNAARLIFAEGDGLPGLIVDAYDDVAVMQCQSAFAETFRDDIIAALKEHYHPTCIVDRSDADVRQLEGLTSRVEVVHGALPTLPLWIREYDTLYAVDVINGHKTGFYLDQRESRQCLKQYALQSTQGAKVLNCFSYTGGFALAALSGGASSTLCVDTSQTALDLGKQAALHNGFAESRHTWMKGDCFNVLKKLHEDNQQFDIVVLDPPKFAPGASHLQQAMRGYQEINRRGMLLLRPGGLLFTYSCSGAVDRPLFHSMLSNAAMDARRRVMILEERGHAADHPVSVHFPEGHYLKGVVATVV